MFGYVSHSVSGCILFALCFRVDQETEKRESDRRIQNRKSVRLGMLRGRQGWGVGPLANKVWIPPESLVGSAPRPCGHEDLGRILREDGSIGKDQETEITITTNIEIKKKISLVALSKPERHAPHNRPSRPPQ